MRSAAVNCRPLFEEISSDFEGACHQDRCTKHIEIRKVSCGKLSDVNISRQIMTVPNSSAQRVKVSDCIVVGKSKAFPTIGIARGPGGNGRSVVK